MTYETSKNSPCGFYWLEEGRLAGSAYPGKCIEWFYHKKGIRAIISLEPLVPEDVQKAQNLGMHIATIPIPDFTAGTPTQRRRILEHIDQFLSRGFPTLVHCKGGLGRTGMILAIYTITRLNLRPKDAIAQIRALRLGSIEENTGQEEAIYEAANNDDTR